MEQEKEQNTGSAPLVSVVVPAFNEEALIGDNLKRICDYLESSEGIESWELLVINDGSTDNTGRIADGFAADRPNVRVLNHPSNFGLGQAFKFGFANSLGKYVITMDVDLSYDAEHIGELLTVIQESHAKIVLASPYMDGGSIKNVPLLRRTLSILGNKFLRLFVRGHFSTLTSMMRAYDGPFIRSLDLRANGMDVMPETLYKAMVLRARISEVPARLDWGPQLAYGTARMSSMRLIRHVFATVLSGFIFRPFLFFIFPGLLIGLFSTYVNFWMFVHFFDAVTELRNTDLIFSYSQAFANAYQQYPHTFVTGLLSAMLAIQLIGLGLVVLQSKRYFEDLFHLGSTRLRKIRRRANH